MDQTTTAIFNHKPIPCTFAFRPVCFHFALLLMALYHMLQTVENYNTELYWKIVLFSSLPAVGIQPMCYFEYSNLPYSIKRLVKAAQDHDYKPFMNLLYESLL